MTKNANARTSTETYLRLLTYLRALIWPFALSIIGFAIFAASQPALAKMMELIIDAIQQKDSDARWVLPLFAVGVFLVRGVGWFLGTYYNEFVGASVIRTIKEEVFAHLVRLPASFYDGMSQGELLHRVNNGVVRIQAALTGALKTLIREGFTIIALLVYVFYLNWKLSLVFLTVAPVISFLVSYATKRFKKISRKNEGALGDAMQVSKELVGNYGVVRGFGAEDYESRRYQKALDKAFDTQMKIRKVSSIFTPLSQVVIALAVAFIIFLLLTPQVLENSTTGELVGYLTAVALLPKPMRQLSGLTVIIQRGVVGADLVFEIMDEHTERDEGDYEVTRVNGDIRVEHLSFRYPAGTEEVLKDISFEVAPGEMVALVGKSGSGKSTLAGLLYRLYDVEDGSIFIDNVDINDYRLRCLREQVAIVNQNISLFDDTIRNNIAYGDREYSDDEVLDALEKAHALEIVEGLEGGLDTIIGENGLKLSGGQRQRLSIARAFLKDAPILILDEATSALDNESETMITKAIESLANKRTTLVIAHRLSTILKADRLLVMDDGRIVEEGNHEALLQQDGVYAALFRAQYS
ncbi:MAG: lipid A export permease/ATP-binding protein MsbA [Ketobacteraceae bacterium]|nr:lipid A export permease/ATP-binding protein MsbA [Ketobacteraceae bacterium]